jgi:5-methylcytosine-specific restriction endonuclease McrA
MLKPRLRALGTPLEERKAKASGRDADKRRTIPLNSAQWQKLRASVLDREPLCRHCARRGQNVAATDVDHISGDPSDNSPDNLQPLCHECHSEKTARDQHYKATGQWRPLKGCDVNGWPMDERHPWNADQKSRGTERA